MNPSSSSRSRTLHTTGPAAPLHKDTIPVLHSRAMSLADIVAQNLLAARTQRNLSQQAVAQKAKLSVSYISMLERGARTPPLETLEVLAKALGVKPLDLFEKSATKVSPRARR
jgi:ribosome-binding protein aMBF1 (putative translation factor)